MVDDFLSYGGGNQWDLHRSFAKPGAMVGFWTGYGSSGLRVQNAIWNAAVRNVLYPSIFWMYSYLDPDFTLSNSARDMGEAFKALRFEGVGKLFMESERLHDGIALHYSMPSVHGNSIYGEQHQDQRGELRSPSGAQEGWVQMIGDLGMQFNFLSYDQVEQGSLASGEYRVLIMPLCVALSPDEVHAIQAFAESGGIVIADAGAGMMDDHCAWSEDAGLNDFFGISTAPPEQRRLTHVAGAVTATPDAGDWGLESGTLEGLDAVEDVTATTGRALLRIGDTDAVVIRKAGEGWAIYLNVCPDSYGRGGRPRRGSEANRGPSLDPAYRALVDGLLSHLGVRPTVQVLDAAGRRLTRVQVVRYRFGGCEALALVTENVAASAVEGQDGVTVYRDDALGEVARQDITVRLPAERYVANARTGAQLGRTDTIRASVVLGDTLVLGITEGTNTIALAGPTAAARGEHPTFAVTSSDQAKALVRCGVVGPNGSVLRLYAQNLVVENGAGTFVLPSALNDSPGDYTLTATDVLTGATARAKIALQ